MDATARGARDLRRFVVGASLAFALLLTVCAWVVVRVRGHAWHDLFEPARLAERVAAGSAVGAGAGLLCVVVVARRARFARVWRLAREAVTGLEPSPLHLVLVALAAGWGEEVFFRGALQPVAGVWLTSAAFAFLHGAHRARSRGAFGFAVFLFAAGAGLGALSRWLGLEAAIAAHAAYDLAVLAALSRPDARPGAG